MNTSLKFFTLIFVMILFAMQSLIYPADRKYTGVKLCGACHKGDKNKNVYEKWTASKHAGAYETLKSEESKKIAGKLGIADPLTSDACLSCHVTNGNKGEGIKAEEGVTCEACHGAGSAYKSKKIMQDRKLALENGLILGKDDESLCKKCHNKKSPTFKKFNYAAEMKKITH